MRDDTKFFGSRVREGVRAKVKVIIDVTGELSHLETAFGFPNPSSVNYMR